MGLNSSGESPLRLRRLAPRPRRAGMRAFGSLFRSAYATALLAVALLTFATVRSTVMQAAELAPSAAHGCGMAMGGMAAMPRGAGQARHSSGKARPLCEFCIAAAHAPLTALMAPPPAPQAVAWIPPVPRPVLGARGPPAFRPKARAPPAVPLTA